MKTFDSPFEGGEDVNGVGGDVAQGEVGDKSVALLLVEFVGIVDDLPGHGEVVVGQHYALRRTRGAGGVDLQAGVGFRYNLTKSCGSDLSPCGSTR